MLLLLLLLCSSGRRLRYGDSKWPRRFYS